MTFCGVDTNEFSGRGNEVQRRRKRRKRERKKERERDTKRESCCDTSFFN